MGIIKVRSWQLMLIQTIAIPVLKRVADLLEKRTEETEEEWDDILAGAFRTVITFFESPDIFEIT